MKAKFILSLMAATIAITVPINMSALGKEYNWTLGGNNTGYTNIGLSFKNKGTQTVVIGVANASLGHEEKRFQVQASQGANIVLDLKSDTQLSIYNCKGLVECYQYGHTTLLVRARFTPQKTIYVKWDGNQITPQKGILGKNDDGLSLKHNVTQKDIKYR